MPSFCYWSIGSGTGYHWILKGAVASARAAGIKEPIHVWTNEPIKDCDVHSVDFTKVKWEALELLNFLNRMYKFFKFDYYVFFHADNVFRHSLPFNTLDLMQKSPIHLFLDSPLLQSSDQFWDGVPVYVCEEKMRELKVATREIYRADTGMWIIHRDAIKTVLNLASLFYKKMKWAGYELTKINIPLVYAMHLLCGDTSLHTQQNNVDFWAVDNKSFFQNKIPTDGPMTFTYSNKTKQTINPAIIHAKKSRIALIDANKPFVPKGLEDIEI